MRLIDADALIKDIDYSADMGGSLGKVVECVKYYAKFMVACAPTIKPKKGKWIDDAETFYKAVNEKGGVNENTPFFTEDDIACSECLSLFSVIDNETERFDFCPHCGARLEEGEADDE